MTECVCVFTSVMSVSVCDHGWGGDGGGGGGGGGGEF